jgi:hypothetical protein
MSGLILPGARGRPVATAQLTCYAIGDDGDQRKGLAQKYTVLSTGQYSGTVNLDVPEYAAATLSFTAATKTIADSASGLASVKTGDTIRIVGSVSNDGVYTVATGGVAGAVVVNESLVDEVAGAYITICKRVSKSNNCVLDQNTLKMWMRYSSYGDLVGAASDGKMNWYNAATCYTLHPAAADLAMVAGNILRITGTDEHTRFFAGEVLFCSGFANAVNNLPGLRVLSVSYVGGNTDIVVDPGNQVLVAEVAGGSRAIKVVCSNIFAYAAAACAAALGGYTDWRVPNINEANSIRDCEQPNARPDAVAFPTWVSSYYWTATTKANGTTSAELCAYGGGGSNDVKTANDYLVLVRG